jgi:purine-binding chemotaxis protein CheW
LNKSLAASKDLMQNYLSELLTEEDTAPVLKEEDPSKVEETKKLNKLLQSVNVAEHHEEKLPEDLVSKQTVSKQIVSKKAEHVEVPKVTEPKVEIFTEIEPETAIATKKSQGELPVVQKHNYRDSSFQAMFFDVAGLTIAVPLVELGGIHNLETTTSLVGKPSWFKGVMLHRDDKINVVDTAQWVMPEKCDDKLKESLTYQYVIMLSNSKWGLLAEHLVDTVTLQPEDVKWLDSPSKRPWLSGLVKDRMCALLEVDALIKLLNDGININQV